MTDVDTTISPDAAIYAATAEEYIERIRKTCRTDLATDLTTIREQVRATMTLLAGLASKLNEWDMEILEGLASADYNLGVLMEDVEEGRIVNVRDTDSDLREQFAMMQERKAMANEDAA